MPLARKSCRSVGGAPGMRIRRPTRSARKLQLQRQRRQHKHPPLRCATRRRLPSRMSLSRSPWISRRRCNVAMDTHTLAVKRLRRFFGHFPQVVYVRDRLKAVIEYRSQDEEPEHLMLLGDPGTGKSTLLTWIARSYPPKEHEAFTEI